MSVTVLVISTASKALISSAVSGLAKSFFEGESDTFPYSRILESYQNWLEDFEKSALKTYRDYYRMGDISKAADALMGASNRDANPMINMLLGATLYKLGRKDIGFEKISNAFNMNPLLAYNLRIPLEKIYNYSVEKLPNSIRTPYVPEDTIANKISRRLGMEVNEGIIDCELCTLGLNISFNFLLEGKNVFGALNIDNGEILWTSTDETEGSIFHLVMNSPLYTVLKKDALYYIYNNSGRCVKSLSEGAFNLLFGLITDIEDLHNSGQYYMGSRVYGDMCCHLMFPFSSTKHLDIKSKQIAKHVVAKGSNRYDVHWDDYYAYKILLSIESKPTNH